MAERDYSNNPEDYYSDSQPGYTPAPSETVAPPSGYVDPEIAEVQRRYNNGSPPSTPLPVGPDGVTTHGWEWDGWDWKMVQGRGIGFGQRNVGYVAPTPGPTSSGDRGGTTGGTVSTTGTSSGVSGVPPSWNVPSSPLSGSVPTLQDAIAGSKLLGQAPQIKPYEVFNPGKAVGLDARNKIVEAILARPETMDQTFQDQLYEQQKEQQAQLAGHARNRAQQIGASRGLSGQGGFSASALGEVEGNFANELLKSRRDISVKAAEVNRANQIAAVQMQEAISQGDFVRANAAYETQLKAQALYDELRFKAAEFDRQNVALSAQIQMSGRQQSLAEQTSSFQQYLDRLKFEELMRQFNEQMAMDYAKFGWDQQKTIVG